MALKHMLRKLWHGNDPVSDAPPVGIQNLSLTDHFAVVRIGNGFLVVPRDQYSNTNGQTEYCKDLNEVHATLVRLYTLSKLIPSTSNTAGVLGQVYPTAQASHTLTVGP